MTGALVTGGAAGIGWAIARAFTARGDRGAIRPEDAGRGRTAGEAGMSALAERIIAARDDMKRHFASHYVLSVMADAANAIVGQEALLKAENAARLDLQNLAADECARADKMRDLLTRAREYVTDALDAHEHSDGRDLLKEIDAALRWTQGEGE